MSGIKDVMKGGWHPKGKDGGKESWRGDFKGLNQVAGWMGKGKDGTKEEASEHRSAPLSTLKDPDSFGPPPKRVLGVTGTPSTTTTSSSGGGLGSALSPARQGAREEEERRTARAEQEKPPPPPVPFRADTTGLSTTGLPPPPKRNGVAAPVPISSSTTAKPKPNLPPRLPPREVAAPPALPASSTASMNNAPSQGVATPLINQSAATRLGRAGISVPGFGIGNSGPDTPASSSQPPSQLSELQSRFSNLNTSSTTPSTTESAPSTGGTTWAQKRAALQTAQNFNKDPSSVSLSDARAAASTANDFHKRHGEQVGQGLRAAKGVNERFGVADKIGRFSGGAGNGESATSLAGNPLAGGKKLAPPPPPVKKKELSELGGGGAAGSGVLPPPPLPMGSKPKMGG